MIWIHSFSHDFCFILYDFTCSLCSSHDKSIFLCWPSHRGHLFDYHLWPIFHSSFHITLQNILSAEYCCIFRPSSEWEHPFHNIRCPCWLVECSKLSSYTLQIFGLDNSIVAVVMWMELLGPLYPDIYLNLNTGCIRWWSEITSFSIKDGVRCNVHDKTLWSTV